MTLTTEMTKEERRAAIRAMSSDQIKQEYIQLVESKGYEKRELGNGITVMVNERYADKYDAGLYDTTTHHWHHTVKGAKQAVICVSV